MQEEQTRAAIEKARQAQLEGRRFLQETLGRQRKKEAEEGVWHRAHLEQRMKAMLSLKGNIEASQVRPRGGIYSGSTVEELVG